MKHLVIFAALLSLLSVRPHEFYVSISEIELENDTLKVAIKLFTDDFEHVLKEDLGQPIFLDNTSDQGKVFRIVSTYCGEHFELSDAGKGYHIEWIGHEFIEDVTWVYGYAIPKAESSILFVRNTLLTDHHHDQHNMVHFRNGENTASKVCSREQPEVRFLIEGN